MEAPDGRGGRKLEVEIGGGDGGCCAVRDSAGSAKAGVVPAVARHELGRSQASKRGRDRARIGVGDDGVWKSSHGAFRNAPSFLAKAEHISSDAEAVGRTLKAMGAKYAGEGWSTYGPRFKEGLADGSRVLLRYRPIAE